MNAVDLMNKQIELANTAHQREVRDLQAAGLNPILSTHSTGAATPNILSDSLIGSSGTSSGKSSAKAIRAAGNANPINKAIGLAGKALDVVNKNAIDQALRVIHPERYNAAIEAANKNQQNFWNQYFRNNSNNANSNQSSNNNQNSANQNSANSNNQLIRDIENAVQPVYKLLGLPGKFSVQGSFGAGLGWLFKKFVNSARNAIMRENGY